MIKKWKSGFLEPTKSTAVSQSDSLTVWFRGNTRRIILISNAPLIILVLLQSIHSCTCNITPKFIQPITAHKFLYMLLHFILLYILLSHMQCNYYFYTYYSFHARISKYSIYLGMPVHQLGTQHTKFLTL